jgi:hypothetical protein
MKTVLLVELSQMDEHSQIASAEPWCRLWASGKFNDDSIIRNALLAHPCFVVERYFVMAIFFQTLLKLIQ